MRARSSATEREWCEVETARPRRRMRLNCEKYRRCGVVRRRVTGVWRREKACGRRVGGVCGGVWEARGEA